MTKQTNIKDYIVVMKDRLVDLEKEVRLFINRGWEPIGSITIKEFNSIGETSYLQPMIRREDNND